MWLWVADHMIDDPLLDDPLNNMEQLCVPAPHHPLALPHKSDVSRQEVHDQRLAVDARGVLRRHRDTPDYAFVTALHLDDRFPKLRHPGEHKERMRLCAGGGDGELMHADVGVRGEMVDDFEQELRGERAESALVHEGTKQEEIDLVISKNG